MGDFAFYMQKSLLSGERKQTNEVKHQTQALMGATRLASGKESAII